MVKQGYEKGACSVTMEGSKKLPACQATLKFKNGMHYRLIKSMHLSRPEDYFQFISQVVIMIAKNAIHMNLLKFLTVNGIQLKKLLIMANNTRK